MHWACELIAKNTYAIDFAYYWNETTCIFSDKYKFWRGFMARFAKKQAQKMKNRVILAKTQHWFIQTLS